MGFGLIFYRSPYQITSSLFVLDKMFCSIMNVALPLSACLMIIFRSIPYEEIKFCSDIERFRFILYF